MDPLTSRKTGVHMKAHLVLNMIIYLVIVHMKQMLASLCIN